MADKKSWMVPGAHMGADPEFFTAWTLFDIGPECEESRGNLAELMSVIAARGQPLLAGIECIDKQDISNSLFGDNITGEHRVWCFKWIASGIGQMTEETLANESNGRKLATGLTETYKGANTVITTGADTNTFFIRHDSF
jgi:hypothetical protein